MNIQREDGHWYCDECGGRITTIHKYAGHLDDCSSAIRIKESLKVAAKDRKNKAN